MLISRYWMTSFMCVYYKNTEFWTDKIAECVI